MEWRGWVGTGQEGRRARVEAGVAAADDLLLAVDAHVPDRRLLNDGAGAVERGGARLHDLRARLVHHAVLGVRLHPVHLRLLREQLGDGVRVVGRELRRHQQVVARRDDAERRRARAAGARAPRLVLLAPGAEHLRVRLRQRGRRLPQVLVALERRHHQVERDRRVLGEHRVEVRRELELGQQRHDRAHLRQLAHRHRVRARAVHHQVAIHDGVDGH